MKVTSMKSNGGLIMVLLFFVVLFSLKQSQIVDPTQCDIKPSSSELISQLEQATKTMIEDKQDHFVDADKMVDPTPSPSPSDKPKVAKREIIMFSQSNCPPCNRWWQCERGSFEAAGYTVAICYDHTYSITPRFAIANESKTIEVVGYLTLERLNEELAR